MTSTKGLLLSAIGRLVLRQAHVTAVEPLAPHLRRVELAGDDLRGAAWVAGDKVQVLLPDRDVRTYTPIFWDAAEGRTALVVHDHGDGPGARWARTVAAGATCGFVGPQRSLARTRGRPAILFGDETSLGVAHAMRRAGPNAPLACVLEVGPGDLAPALATLELDDAVSVPRQAHDAHLRAVADHIHAAQRAHPHAELILSGRAQSIQTLRGHLRAAGAAHRGASKAYWSVGKSGLD